MPQIVRDPVALGDCVVAEQRANNLAIGGAIEPAIEPTQCKDQAVTAGFRQCSGIGTGVAAGQASPEPDRGDCAGLEYPDRG
jgi:hypothetical protein